jgi:hypothetical protein
VKDDFNTADEKTVAAIGRRLLKTTPFSRSSKRLVETVKIMAGVSRIEDIPRPQREALARAIVGRLRVAHLLKPTD